MSAAALSHCSKAESSRFPITSRTLGERALTCFAFSLLRTNKTKDIQDERQPELQGRRHQCGQVHPYYVLISKRLDWFMMDLGFT